MDSTHQQPASDVAPSEENSEKEASDPVPKEASTGPIAEEPPVTGLARVWRLIFGKGRNVEDPHVFHKMSLVAFLAWVGLGADGLSSSAYGPEAAFKALCHSTRTPEAAVNALKGICASTEHHSYLAIALAVAVAMTVFIISYAYSRIIEHFPSGGGGYVVATSLIGEKAGVISGSALIIDYVLTITVSVVEGVNSIFNFLPPQWAQYKLPLSAVVIIVLMLLNIRGVKESVRILVPIFIVFLVTHAFLLLYGIFSHTYQIPQVAQNVKQDFHQGLGVLGYGGMIMLFLRAYALGGSSYTGIEAVSNGLMIMREPRAATGRKTMVYMAVSLAVTAGGILICYLLSDVYHLSKLPEMQGKTFNGILVESLYGKFQAGGVPLGKILAVITLLAEAALLTVAAQAGFLDGPRVMSNMAVDSWLPHRFAALSEQLTMTNGILLMGGAALAVLFYTKGSTESLLTMYSINVFVTFTLSQLGMCKFWIKNRYHKPGWKRHLPIHVIGTLLCVTVLIVTIMEKFRHGAWLTLVVTGILVLICYGIRRHYRRVYERVRSLDELLTVLPSENRPGMNAPLEREARTAVLLVSSYSGLGVHTLLSVLRQFPGLYKQFVFVSVAVVDSGSFKGAKEVHALKEKTQADLDKYVSLARRIGVPADSMIAVGTDVIEEAEQLCMQAADQYPNMTVFAGKLVFQNEHFWERLLHHQMVYSLQRRLQWKSLNVVILPIRVT